MQQKKDIKDVVADGLWNIFKVRIDTVYSTYRDLPRIQALENKHSEFLELDAELCYRFEENLNELHALHEELIYRQGIIDSDEMYKSFKDLNFIPDIEKDGGI